jgi:rhodanese-related sulfurtransferase
MSYFNNFVTYIQPREAWDLLAKENKAILVDVRSELEVQNDGRPDLSTVGKTSYLVPWQNSPGSQIESDFSTELTRLFPDKENTVLLFMCRAGVRSKMAAYKALSIGYKHCLNIKDGFEGGVNENGKYNQISGWKFSKLPWEKV